MSSAPSQQSQSRRPSLPMIPIPTTLNPQNQNSNRGATPLTPIGYARNHSRRSSVSTSLPSSANSLSSSLPFRRGSISSISSTSTSGFGGNGAEYDNAIAEDDDFGFGNGNGGKKEEGLSFARRMSFGARALGGVVNRGPVSPVGPSGRGFFPDSESRNPGLKDHLDGQRRRGMSLGAAQAPPPNLRHADAAVQGKVKPSPIEFADPFEERIVRGEMYMD